MTYEADLLRDDMINDSRDSADHKSVYLSYLYGLADIPPDYEDFDPIWRRRHDTSAPEVVNQTDLVTV